MRGQSQFVARMRREGILRRQLLRDLAGQRRFDAAPDIDLCQFIEFGGRQFGQLATFAGEIGGFRIGLRTHRHVFAGGHRRRTGDKTGDAGHEHLARRRRRGGNTDDKAGRRNDAVIGAEDRRAQPADAVDEMSFAVQRAHVCLQ